MQSRLVDRWDRIRSSYWFVPSLMFVGALVLAALTLWLDLSLTRDGTGAASPLFPRFAADAARSILSTLASGMLTVTGVVFSLTVVALQLASSQFGPRLLRAFMNSLGTQIVLGTFTSSFVFYLLIVGTVRADLDFVPQISTATGIVLGVVDIAVLIYFVHHLATSIRIESLLVTLNADLRLVIDDIYPSEIGEDIDTPVTADWQTITRSGGVRNISAASAGYIRHIDADTLMNMACRHDLVLRLALRPGAFVVEGTVLLSGWPEERVSDGVVAQLRAGIVLGWDRTPLQDADFAIRQLVEVALRALSPGINDPFTAVECTDRLAEALCVVSRRHRPSALRCDDEGRLRVIAEPMPLQAMVKAAFDPIARAGGHNGDVAHRLLTAITTVASCAREADDRRFLIGFAKELEQQMLGQLTLERDRIAVAASFRDSLQQILCQRLP